MENIREEWEFNVMFEGFNWFNHQQREVNEIYPLVNIPKTMENHHCW
jgi:hypothetical protein